MTNKVYNVLFLCTDNSARSIFAEALLNHWGRGKFRGFSAGSCPQGQVHPLALELLQQMALPTGNLRSKSWDEFAARGAPRLDFMFTVCTNAAREACPMWPVKPITAHWGIADPAAAVGTDAEQALAFRKAFRKLEARIKLFTAIPTPWSDGSKLRSQLSAIGRTATESGE